MSSPKEKHRDVEESKTPVDQPSQDVTGSNPSVNNQCGDVTGPEPFYQRPEVRIASLVLKGTWLYENFLFDNGTRIFLPETKGLE